MLDSLKKIIKLRQSAEHAASALPSLMIEARNIANNIHHGEHAKRKEGAGEEFWQFRDYVQGDRLQDIDWRQSGKTDHIYIRQKELHVTRKTFFWCAGDKGMEFTSSRKYPHKHEAAQIITLALALLMTRAQEQIGYFGDSKTGCSAHSIEKIGMNLITQDPQSLPHAHEFALPRNASFVAVGDFLSPLDQIRNCFETISSRGAQSLIIQTLDPSEINLDFNGRIQFEGIDKKDKEIIDHIPSIRDEYQHRIHEHIEGIKELCRKFGWRYVLHTTDQSIDMMLSQLWQDIQAQRIKA